MPNRDHDQITTLRRNTLFASLRISVARRLVADANVRELARSDSVYQAGDPSREICVLLSGSALLRVGTSVNNTRVLAVLEPSNPFGLAEAILNTPRKTSAEVLEHAKILLIHRDAIIRLTMRDARFALNLVRCLAQEVSGLTLDIEAISCLSAPERVAAYLLQLAQGSAQPRQALALPAKKSAIASRLGMTPEFFSRTLHELIGTGAITVDGRQITLLDPSRLPTR